MAVRRRYAEQYSRQMDYGAGIRAEVGHQRADSGELAPSREALWQATAWGADVDPYGGRNQVLAASIP